MGNQTQKEQPLRLNPVELQTHVMVVQTKLNLNRNKKVELIKRKRKEIAACLEDNSLDIAKAKMDSIIKEEDFITVFDILGPLCEILKEKISYLLLSEKCPDDLRATLDTIIYASTRLEIEELHKIRGIVKSKYGELYITKANSNSDSLVNVNVVEKMKIKQAADPYIVARLKQLVKEDNIQYEFPQEVIPVIGTGGSHLTFETSPENFGFNNFNGNFQAHNFNNNFNDMGNMNNFNLNNNVSNFNNMNYPNMNNNIGINNMGGGNNMNISGNPQYNMNNIHMSNMNNMKNMNQMNMNNVNQVNQMNMNQMNMNQMNVSHVSQMSQMNQMNMNQNNMSQMNMNNSNVRNQNPNVNLSQSPGNFNLPNIQTQNLQNNQNIQNNQSQNMGVNVNLNNNQNINSGLPTQSIVLNPSNIYMNNNNNNNQMNMSNFNQSNFNMTPGNNSVVHSKNGINENSVNFNLIDRSVNYQGNESVNPYLGDFNKNSGFNKMDVSQQSMGQRLYSNNSVNNQITPGGFNDINAPSVIDSHNYEINVKQNSYVAGDMGFPKAKSDPNNDDVMSLFPKSNKSRLDDFPKSKGDI